MTIELALSYFSLPHLLIGTVALVTFWTAALAKKGSPPHKAVGRIYLVSMIGVVATGIPLTAAYALAGQWVAAAFLGYLIVLVSHACRMAWTAILCKRDFARYSGIGFRLSAAALAATGAAVVVIGVLHNAWLLIIFGLLGPIGGLDAAALIRNGPSGPKWWLKEHYGAMIGNGVATHIAFLQIGLMRLVPELSSTMTQHLAWFGPLAVAIASGFWLDRRYMRPRSAPTGSAS